MAIRIEMGNILKPLFPFHSKEMTVVRATIFHFELEGDGRVRLIVLNLIGANGAIQVKPASYGRSTVFLVGYGRYRGRCA